MLTFFPATDLQDFSLGVSGPFSSNLQLRGKDQNLVLKAARLMQKKCGSVIPFGHFDLVKNLPVAAGLGGGSADAAACLRLLNRMFEPGLNRMELAGLALELGADLPACIHSQPLIMRGIGEEMELVKLTCAQGWPILLINPMRPCPTNEIFQRLNFNPAAKISDPVPPISELDRMALISLLKKQRNDLEPAAIAFLGGRPAWLHTATQTDPLILRMSGSGATWFALYTNTEKMQQAAKLLTEHHPDLWITMTCLHSAMGQ